MIILHDMDLNTTPTPLTASIWRSCAVVMRRNLAVCTHAHSKYMGSGSGML